MQWHGQVFIMEMERLVVLQLTQIPTSSGVSICLISDSFRHEAMHQLAMPRRFLAGTASWEKGTIRPGE